MKIFYLFIVTRIKKGPHVTHHYAPLVEDDTPLEGGNSTAKKRKEMETRKGQGREEGERGGELFLLKNNSASGELALEQDLPLSCFGATFRLPSSEALALLSFSG